MAYGNNRSGEQPRAHFQQAGGTIIKFKHPYLVGQVSSENTSIDEIDVSACCKLDGRYFEATPNQDSAYQTVLIDGTTVTITNRLMNGTITMPIIKGGGLVSKGDFIAALQLIKSIGDTVGGLLYKTDFIDGVAITRMYYGVTVQNLPDDIGEGMSVPEYTVRLLYAGWVEAISATSSVNEKAIWATGTSKGVTGYYTPYKAQEGGTGTAAVTKAGLGISDGADDDSTADKASVALVADKTYRDTAEEITKNYTVKVGSVNEWPSTEAEPEAGSGS